MKFLYCLGLFLTNKRTMSKVEIIKKTAGPIVIKGEVSLSTDDGVILETKPVFSLCGCGKSNNIPFCDGEHKK